MVGFPPELLPYLMIGLLALVLAYTVVGGMVSVVLTDYIQFIILFSSVLLGTYFAIADVGYPNVVGVVQAQYGDGGFNPFVNEDLGWSFVVWIAIGALFSGMWPPAMSRALSTTDSETTRRMYAFIGFSFLGRALLPMMWGICAFAYFKLHPSVPLPVEDGVPDTAAAMPIFLAQTLPAGVKGLMAAAALAAMMSTFDSYLLCWSSIFVNDIIVPLRRREMTDQHKIWLTRLSIVCCGIFVLLWGYLYKPPQTILRFMIITGTMYSASVMLTTAMGLYWKRANTAGTFTSLVIAGALPLTAIFVKDASALPESLRWMASDKLVGMATYLCSLVSIVVASLATQRICPPRKLVYPADELGVSTEENAQ